MSKRTRIDQESDESILKLLQDATAAVESLNRDFITPPAQRHALARQLCKREREYKEEARKRGLL